MNKKGLYSGSIALATIVLVIAVSFNIVSTGQAEESMGKADAIINAKWEVQNMGHLLEATAVDAMIDAIFVACSYDTVLIKSKFESYVLEPSIVNLGECTVSNIVVSGGAANTLISFELKCTTNAATGLTTEYNKIISFQKSATITPLGAQCTVSINDVIPRPFGYEIVITE